jgi:hypothetical protein
MDTVLNFVFNHPFVTLLICVFTYSWIRVKMKGDNNQENYYGESESDMRPSLKRTDSMQQLQTRLQVK